MANMDELAFALQMRDTIAELVKEEIQKQRPRFRYAVVDTVDIVNFKANVIYNGDTSAVTVNTGHFRYVDPGDVVRIDGIGTDKFIVDIINWDGIWAGASIGSITATANTTMRRDASGRSQVASPSAGGDIVNKTYADALGTDAATANTIMRRDASARAKVANPSAATDIANKTYVDTGLSNVQLGTAIPNTADLNTYTTPGIYTQASNAWAAAGTNYPAPFAGVLEMFNAGGTYIQRYSTYGDAVSGSLTCGTAFQRTYTSGAWTAWKWLGGGDSGLITSGIATAQSGWSITSQQFRRWGPFVYIYLAVTYTGATITVPASGNITNSNVATIASDWTPATGLNASSLNSASTGRMASFAISAAGVIGLAAVAPGGNIASGEDWTLSGFYMQ